jgi:hypothetical protein
LLLLALSIMLGVGIVFYKNYKWVERQNVTNERVKNIHEALVRYRFENNRLPCPAKIDAPVDSSAFGREQDNCAETITLPGARGNGNVRYGAVPIRSLNLPDTYLIDGWGHRINYAVTQYYTSKNPSLDINSDKGAITVKDGKSLGSTTIPGNIIFLVMSPGEDKRGAYNLNGILQEPCATDSIAGENCDNKNSVFVSTIYKQWNIGKDTYTASMSYLASSKAYSWKTSNWTECNCDVLEQTRTATCIDEHGNQPHPGNQQLNDSFCSAAMKPPLKKECVAYCRDAGPWTPCVCDGISTRITYCRANNGDRVGDTFCKHFPALPTTRACQTCPPEPTTNSDPLIFDLTGDGIRTIRAKDGVLFDMMNANNLSQTGWVHPDDGLLAKDLNGDGKIKSQDELFGKKDRGAFDELADYDSNGDGDITPEDDKWHELKIWRDRNSNGITDNRELRSLDYWKIRRIPLVHDEVFFKDEGNDVTGTGYFERFVEGVGLVKQKIIEVLFAVITNDPPPPPPAP